jgi:L-2-hydroxycarboxylate dehydrogenase (NAD+)
MPPMLVEARKVRAVAVAILTGNGFPAGAAEIQADLFIEAELRGHPSHGLLRLPRVVERTRAGLTEPKATGAHVWRGTALLEVDGERGPGPVVALAAIDRIRARARETGVAAAAVRNANHLGMLSYYVEKIAAGGQIGIATTTSEALVHPWGGREAMLGTNPLAIGVPAEPHPLVYDSATGIVSMGKIHDYAHRGQPLPEGWALDGNGDPTTDAAAATSGAIAPFGGAKGYGLGIGLEVLVAALTATSLGTAVRGTLDSVNPSTKGDLFIVFENPAGAESPISAYLDQVRRSRPDTPDHPVQVPGDRARRRRAAALDDGVDVAEPVWAELLRLERETTR